MNADSLLHWLMRTSLEASVLILAVLGLRWVLGTRLSPAWRIGLWMLVGAKLMLPAFVPAGFGLGAWMQEEKRNSATDSTMAARQQQTAVVALHQLEQPSGGSLTRWSFSPKALLVGVWLMGAAGILLVALARQRRFERILRSRRPASDPHLLALVARLGQRASVLKHVKIILMPAGTAPAMVGIRQPKMLLPEDWETRFDERSLRHVVLHELFHVKQGDLLWNWIALAVQAVHWFNPLVWFVVSRFQADRELRCDAGALSQLSPTERLDYGHTLLRIQQTFFAPPSIAGLAPCVRNHPTLRQRILMIARPTRRQPWIHALLVLTLGVLVCYSFTTASAQEKAVPPKERTREASRTTPAPTKEGEEDGKKTAAAERTGDGGTKKPGMRDGDGGARKPGTGDAEGTKKPGMKESDGGTKKPGAMRDGEKARSGERDGGKPRSGERDGEKPRTGMRDGEGKAKSTEATTTASNETITLRVVKSGEAVMVGEEEVSMNRLRGHLMNFLPSHPGARIEVTGDGDAPLNALHNTVDAVRDNGNKNVGIKAE